MAQDLGWEVAGIFVDTDRCGSAEEPCPEYERLLAGIESGEVRAVVAYDLNLVASKPGQLEAFTHLANRKRIALAQVAGEAHLVSAGGSVADRSDGEMPPAAAVGRTLERRAHTSGRQRWRGRPPGTRFRVYGYTKDWKVLEDEAGIVEEIFHRAAQGETRAAITRHLQDRRMRTVTGARWALPNTTRLLRYAPYAGLATYKGKVVRKSEIPAVVDEGTFYAVQDLGPPTTRGRARDEGYLLSGLVFCGECQAPMTGANQTYRCDTDRGDCGTIAISTEYLDGPITARLISYLSWDEPQEPQNLPDYQAEVDAADAQILALQAAVDAGATGLGPLLKESRHTRMRVLQASVDVDVRAAQIAARAFAGRTVWTNAEVAARRKVISGYVQHIAIERYGQGPQHPDSRGRIIVHWQDGKVQDFLRDIPLLPEEHRIPHPDA